MTKDIAQRILALNAESYQVIAGNFSQTRKYAWDDFRLLDEYVQEGMTVLDIGCGNGRLFEYLASKKVHYTGIDMSTNFIQIAKEQYGDHELAPIFLYGDVLSLEAITELKNKQFDLIIGVAVLCHIPKTFHNRVIEQIKPLLKQNGTLALYNWNLWRPSLRQKSVWRALKERLMMPDNQWLHQCKIEKSALGPKDVMTLWQSGPTKAPLYYYAFTIREVSALLSNNGFTIKETFYTKHGKQVHWWEGNNLLHIVRKK